MPLSNNDTFRRLRYALRLDDATMTSLFSLGMVPTSALDFSCWLKKDTEAGFRAMLDCDLAAFLDGLIIHKRGRKEGQEPVAPAVTLRLSNNDVLKKIKIALELREDDFMAIMQSVDMPVSKAELGGLFRQVGHRNYKECGDQFLRNFLAGLANHSVQSKHGPRTEN